MNGILLPVVIVAVIGLVAGVILTVAAKFMSVPVDKTVAAVREVLPGANCGACGCAGCDEYAEKLVHEGLPTNMCTPGGAEVSIAISIALGADVMEVESRRAVIKCVGTKNTARYIMDYQGPRTCEACNFLYQGHRACSYGCLGYGDCIQACKYDAIQIINGLAVIDWKKCIGCGMCVSKCPNHLIEIVHASSEVVVACASHDKGGFTRKFCHSGCIGCMRCAKVCDRDAIVFDRYLARVDHAKCDNCGKCLEVCPTKTIRRTNGLCFLEHHQLQN